jgi:hypothetical protein
MEPIDTLVDSGALGEFMPIVEARRRDLKISPCNTIIGVGDNRTITTVGKTLLRLNINGHVVERPVILLQYCPHKLILGCKFFYEYTCDIFFSSRCLHIHIPYNGLKETTKVPFRLSGTPLVATCSTIVPPNTETKVKVNPDPIFHDTSMNEEARWGLVTGSQSDDRLIAHGVVRLCDPHDEDYNWVNDINPINDPITIEKGEVMAHHAETDLLNMTITKVDTETMTTDDNSVTLSQSIRDMTIREIDEAIANNPHLKDLDLTGTAGLMSAEQLTLLKRVVVQHHRLWDTNPKPIPDDVTRCDIRIKDGEHFRSQGRNVPTNPATRKVLRETIESQLHRGVIEPSTVPCSSTVLLVLKPGGGVRFCIDYRALNKVIEPDAYTLPTVQENLAAMSGDKFFSCLDMKEAF